MDFYQFYLDPSVHLTNLNICQGLAAAALPKSPAATAAWVIANLRQVISAQSPRGGTVKPPIAIGLSNLDAALHGGLPSGKLVEVIGQTGKMSLTLRSLAGATRRANLSPSSTPPMRWIQGGAAAPEWI